VDACYSSGISPRGPSDRSCLGGPRTPFLRSIRDIAKTATDGGQNLDEVSPAARQASVCPWRLIRQIQLLFMLRSIGGLRFSRVTETTEHGLRWWTELNTGLPRRWISGVVFKESL